MCSECQQCQCSSGVEQITVFNIGANEVFQFNPGTSKGGILELTTGYTGASVATQLYLIKGSIPFAEAKEMIEKTGQIPVDLMVTYAGGPQKMKIEPNIGELTVVNINATAVKGQIKITQ